MLTLPMTVKECKQKGCVIGWTEPDCIAISKECKDDDDAEASLKWHVTGLSLYPDLFSDM